MSKTITPTRIQDVLPELAVTTIKSLDEVTKLYTVTPQWIKKLDLDDRTVGVNRDNRPHSVAHIRRLADLITAGEWIEDLDPILYVNEPGHPWDGKILSGQHRLRAIEKANIPCKVRFKGVPVDVSAYVDTGRRRTMADNTAMVLGVPKTILTMMNHYYGFMQVNSGYNYTISSGNSLTQRKHIKAIENAYSNKGTVFLNIHQNYRQANAIINVNAYKSFIAVLTIGEADLLMLNKFVQNTINSNCVDDAMIQVIAYYNAMHKTGIDPYKVLIHLWNSMLSGVPNTQENTIHGIDVSKLDIFDGMQIDS